MKSRCVVFIEAYRQAGQVAVHRMSSFPPARPLGHGDREK